MKQQFLNHMDSDLTRSDKVSLTLKPAHSEVITATSVCDFGVWPLTVSGRHCDLWLSVDDTEDIEPCDREEDDAFMDRLLLRDSEQEKLIRVMWPQTSVPSWHVDHLKSPNTYVILL